MDAFRQNEFERDKERLALADASKQKSFERRMKYVASTAKTTPSAEKIDPASIGDGNCKFQGIILPETERYEGALKADAYGFYGNWDWTPEQIKKMQASIPCKGVETDEEFYENLGEALKTKSNPKGAIANTCMVQVNAK